MFKWFSMIIFFILKYDVSIIGLISYDQLLSDSLPRLMPPLDSYDFVKLRFFCLAPANTASIASWLRLASCEDGWRTIGPPSSSLGG